MSWGLITRSFESGIACLVVARDEGPDAGGVTELDGREVEKDPAGVLVLDRRHMQRQEDGTRVQLAIAAFRAGLID